MKYTPEKNLRGGGGDRIYKRLSARRNIVKKFPSDTHCIVQWIYDDSQGNGKELLN